MDDLIEALQIFRKYKNEYAPTHCTHDTLWVVGVTQEEVSPEDSERLRQLGFHFSKSEGWISYRFGSA